MMTNFTNRTRAIISTAAIALSLSYAMPAIAQESASPATKEQAAPQSVTGWGIPTNDLTPDPAVKYGTLPNGMKYAIRKNETPKGAASVRFTIDAGSLAEAENEQGLAHFLEHMAFNGSTKFPEGELVKKLERLGLVFGADTQAETSQDKTIYKLDLPKADTEIVDTALIIMRETASELTISPAAVDRERGVLNKERQARNTADARSGQHFMQNGLPSSKLGYRLPGGVEEVLLTAPAQRIRDFYHRYYRPERATLVIVGHIDPVVVEQSIKARFSDWRGKGVAGTIDDKKVDPTSTIKFTNFSDPAASERVMLSRFKNTEPVKNTKVENIEELNDLIWTLAMANRLDSLGRVENAKVTSGQSGMEPLGRDIMASHMFMFPKDGKWQAALAATEQEIRRAAQFGFTKSEMEDALNKLDGILAQAAQTQASRTHVAIADELTDNSLTNSFAVLPSDNYQLYNELKPGVSLEAVNAAFRKEWGNGPALIQVTSKAPIADFSSLASQAWSESKKMEVTAPTEKALAKFAYDSFGKPGRVKSDNRIADLDIRTIKFANGVMLNIKKTDFEKGKIHFGINVGSGLAAQRNVLTGLPFVGANMSQFDGLAAHDVEELQRIIAGRRVALGLQFGMDGFGLGGAVSPQDLEFQLKLAAATTTAFGYRPETEAQWKNYAPTVESQNESTAEAVFQTLAPAILAGNDARFGQLDIGSISKRTMAELKTLIQSELTNGPIQISLVGDIDEDAAIALVAKTFGALPKRGKALPIVQTSFPKDLTPRILTHKGNDEQAFVSLNWPATDDSDFRSTLTRDLLAAIMRDRLLSVIREKLGAAYSPYARHVSSNVIKDYGFLQAAVGTDPANSDIVKAEILKIAQSLRNAPPSNDELLRVRKPISERYAAQIRRNDGWAGLILFAQTKPDRLDRRRQRDAVLASITTADIQKAAQQYLLDDKALEIRVVSESVAKQMAAPKP
jgi:zinc protease